ncbi:hypothetical protein AGLY_007413 [Aphis glycines]|uniref:Uncharacterized protein n=1 Tax=Aphis glycines TaxID=307491 RepID=A0A6G0TNR0_APHGL|nr:hypothetical protein AGLY_007413 [Aphis glycines]
MDDALPDTVTREINNIVFRKDRYLSSALLITEIKYMFENEDNPQALKHEHRALLQNLRCKKLTLVRPELFYSWCMEQALGEHGILHQNTTEFMTIFRASEGRYLLAHQDWTFEIAPTTPLRLPRLITQIYDRKTKKNDLFDSNTYDTRLYVEWKVRNIEDAAYGNLHLVRKNATKAFVITHAHLAGIRDMITAWFDT